MAEIGRSPGETNDNLAVRCQRALGQPEAACAEVAAVLAAVLDEEAPAILAEALRDEEVAIAAAWVARFGPIATDAQFAAIVRTARLVRRQRAGEG